VVRFIYDSSVLEIYMLIVVTSVKLKRMFLSFFAEAYTNVIFGKLFWSIEINVYFMTNGIPVVVL
jgi:hypothetical protein